ncbi:MAG TPA: ABC transporter ATP-binding protein [Pyrinomonadaceae bacterium]|jgi:ABC-2 type transport system ATP-binding protein|nr:ABC transporter ATP-binding protein [Pyrinomonadaceae bacterium]
MKATDAETERCTDVQPLHRRGDTETKRDAHLAPETAPVAVSIEHLSKTYPVPLARLKQFFRRKSARPVEALRDVSFDIKTGEVFGLIGRNGAGKTTLTKIIATLVQPTTGAVKVRGHDSVGDEQLVRAQIGLASAEERSFYWRLTAEQNLVFFARLYGLPDRAARTRIRELLALIELEEVARRRFGELSTGNKQRMAVARALLNSPPILLLDEPTRSLDPLAAARLRALIGSLARATPPVTILLTSHNLAEIEELCERVAIIGRGRIRATGTPSKMRALHRQQERVRINVRGVAASRVAEILPDAHAEVSAHDADVLITLLREPSDDSLDRTLRALLADGARVVSCETERATLLDVLESYEGEETEAEAQRLEGGRKEGEKGGER